MNRRDFLKFGLAAPVAATMAPKKATAAPKAPIIQLPGNPYAPTTLAEKGSRSVLILGGGLAGLSAALEFADRG